MVNVLFVDDETGFLEVITKRMAKRGMASMGIASGEEAITLIEKQPFDVVVLDIKMPGGRSGIEILKEIKPNGVQVYTIDRGTTEEGIKPASKKKLEKIVEMLKKQANINAVLY